MVGATKLIMAVMMTERCGKAIRKSGANSGCRGASFECREFRVESWWEAGKNAIPVAALERWAED